VSEETVRATIGGESDREKEQGQSAEKPNAIESEKVKEQQSEVRASVTCQTTELPSDSLSSDYPRYLALGGSSSSSDYLPIDSLTEQIDREILSQQ
jgi:hypothetical protein